MQELDGILDGDDVQRARRVEVRRPCSAIDVLLPLPAAPHDEHHPVRASRPAPARHRHRQPQRLHRRDVARDEAHDDGEGAALPVHVDAEAADARRGVRRVVLLELVEVLPDVARCVMTMRATASVSSGVILSVRK